MWRLDGEKLAIDVAAEDVRRRSSPRGSRVMEPIERRVLEMAAVVGETLVARRDHRARALGRDREPDRSGRPDARRRSRLGRSQPARGRRRDRQARRARVAGRGPAVVDRRASASCGSRTRTCGRSSTRASTSTPPRLPRASSRAGSSFTPRAARPAAQEEVGRHLALAGETREAAIRYRRAAEAARAAVSRTRRAIRLFDRALACIGDHDLAQRASTSGTTSARSTS